MLFSAYRRYTRTCHSMRTCGQVLLGLVLVSAFTFVYLSTSLYKPGTQYADTALLVQNSNQHELAPGHVPYAWRSLKRDMAELLCTPGVNSRESGGYCLDPNKKAEIMRSHYPFDTKLAESLGTHLFRNRTVIDMGAGPGHYGAYWLHKKLIRAYRALDGGGHVEAFTDGLVHWTNLAEPLSWQWQITDAEGKVSPVHWYTHWPLRDGAPRPDVRYLPKAEWIMSLEVLEHVPMSYECQVLDNIDALNQYGVVLSWAIPKQGGLHHVNNRPNTYAIERMQDRGYVYCRPFSVRIRRESTLPWFKNTLMVFFRNSTLESQHSLWQALCELTHE